MALPPREGTRGIMARAAQEAPESIMDMFTAW